jgi:hypothetical protein
MTDPETASQAIALVKMYAGSVVDDVARALAVIALDTRPEPNDTISEASKMALRVTEAARLLVREGSAPFSYLSADEQDRLIELLDLYTKPPQDEDET